MVTVRRFTSRDVAAKIKDQQPDVNRYQLPWPAGCTWEDAKTRFTYETSYITVADDKVV